MRIASNMMSYNFLRSLNKSMEKENTLQQQLADGKALHRPSDDPVNTVRDLHYTSNQVQNEQFQGNLSTAQSWMENTDGVMSDLSSIMIKAKELVVSADDTKPTDALNTIGSQIDGLVNQIVQLGNTKIGTRYLFGGQNDSTQPFTRMTIKDPNSDLTQEVVVYNGDDNKLSMAIQAGVANPLQDSVNINGTEAFGPTSAIFGKQTMTVLNQLIQTKNELQKKASISQTNSNGGIGTVGGTYTGSGYQTFNVRIDEVDGGVAYPPTIGQVTKASYSTDGGATWTSAAVDSATSTNSSTITLANGVSFNITNSTKNKPLYTDNAVPPTINTDASGATHADVYTVRVPQAAYAITASNPNGGAAEISGTYTGSGSTNYSVKAASVNSSGQITAASYSTDNGSTWTYLSNYAVTSSNSSGPVATVLGNGATLPAVDNFSLQVGAVDSKGLIISATLASSSPANGVSSVSYETSYDTDTQTTAYTSVINLANGQTVKIPASSLTKAGDTFTANSLAKPVVDTSAAGTTAFTLPNGVSLHVAADTQNTAKDTYAFSLPQGTGPDVKWLSAVATQQIDDTHSMQLKAQTTLGTRMATYTMALNILQGQNAVIQSDVSSAEDLNVPQAITDFNTAQNVYRSALAVGARIMKTSLVDFLS